MQHATQAFIERAGRFENVSAATDMLAEHLAKQPPETVAAAKLAIELAADLDRGQGRNV